jgi:hypothetical protein
VARLLPPTILLPPFEPDTLAPVGDDPPLRCSRRKGKWIGGTPPLGYDVAPEGGRLIINDSEAAQVEEMFALYARYGGLDISRHHPGCSKCAGGFRVRSKAGMAQNFLLFRCCMQEANAPPCNHWVLRGMGMARKPCVPVASVYHPTIAPPGFMPRACVTVAQGNVRDANDPSSSRKP